MAQFLQLCAHRLLVKVCEQIKGSVLLIASLMPIPTFKLWSQRMRMGGGTEGGSGEGGRDGTFQVCGLALTETAGKLFDLSAQEHLLKDVRILHGAMG